MGEPGLDALGMTLVALLTGPLALTGIGLGLGGWQRDPQGLGRAAVLANGLYLVGMVALTVGSF